MVLKFPLFKLIISFLPIVFMRILHYTFIFDKYQCCCRDTPSRWSGAKSVLLPADRPATGTGCTAELRTNIGSVSVPLHLSLLSVFCTVNNYQTIQLSSGQATKAAITLHWQWFLKAIFSPFSSDFCKLIRLSITCSCLCNFVDRYDVFQVVILLNINIHFK